MLPPMALPPPRPASAAGPVRPPWPLRALDALAARPRLAVALAAVLPFLITLDNPPILDDGWAALDNPLTWSLGRAGRIFRELYGFAGEPSVRGPYRPITTLSYAINYAVHGRFTPGYHAVNVALHAAASLLALALARRLAGVALPGREGRVALLAGLLFALHPAHVEAVATIFGRTEPLSACFALGALLLALDRRSARWKLPGALALLVAGVLAKEVAIVTPALFLGLALALPRAAGLAARPGLRDAPARRALLEAAGVAALLLAAFVPYLLGRGPALAVAPEARWFPAETPGWSVALTMSRVLAEYLRILAFPSFLGGDFAYAARLPTLAGPTAGFALGTAAWLGALAVAALLLRPAPLAAAGIAWIFLPLLPVLQIVPVGVLLAERLLYLPSVGFCLAAAAALGAFLPGAETKAAGAAGPAQRFAGQRAAAVASAAGLAAAALLAGRTVARTLDWRTDVAYWSSELEKAPRQPVVNNNLAVAHMARREYPQAVERLRVALEVQPRYWRSHVNLAISLAELGRPEEARRSFEAALRLGQGSADPPYYYARWLGQAGEVEAALRLLAGARALRPEEARLPLLQGELLLRQGRAEEARRALHAAAALDPKDPRARALLERAGPAGASGP